MNKTGKIISGIVILLIFGAISFYFGMNYGKSQATATVTSARAGFASRAGRGSANGGGFTSGTIISSDSSSITLQLPNNGGSAIIFYSNATQISKFAAGTAADLATGTSVSVTGTTNSDGSITAQSIQIRPAMQNSAAPAQ